MLKITLDKNLKLSYLSLVKMKLGTAVNLIDSENFVLVALGNEIFHIILEWLTCWLQIENNLSRNDVFIVERNLEQMLDKSENNLVYLNW